MTPIYIYIGDRPFKRKVYIIITVPVAKLLHSEKWFWWLMVEHSDRSVNGGAF